MYGNFGFFAKVMVSPIKGSCFGLRKTRNVYMNPYMHVTFLICYFSIWMSGCIVKEVIDVVVDVIILTCRNMCVNRCNCDYHGRVDFISIEEEGANDLLSVDDL